MDFTLRTPGVLGLGSQGGGLDSYFTPQFQQHPTGALCFGGTGKQLGGGERRKMGRSFQERACGTSW